MKTNLKKLREEMSGIMSANTRGIQAIIKQTCEEIWKDVNKLKVIAEHGYGEDDGSNKIKLTKYLIDRAEVKQLLKVDKK